MVSIAEVKIREKENTPPLIIESRGRNLRDTLVSLLEKIKEKYGDGFEVEIPEFPDIEVEIPDFVKRYR